LSADDQRIHLLNGYTFCSQVSCIDEGLNARPAGLESGAADTLGLKLSTPIEI